MTKKFFVVLVFAFADLAEAQLPSRPIPRQPWDAQPPPQQCQCPQPPYPYPYPYPPAPPASRYARQCELKSYEVTQLTAEEIMSKISVCADLSVTEYLKSIYRPYSDQSSGATTNYLDRRQQVLYSIKRESSSSTYGSSSSVAFLKAGGQTTFGWFQKLGGSYTYSSPTTLSFYPGGLWYGGNSQHYLQLSHSTGYYGSTGALRVVVGSSDVAGVGSAEGGTIFKGFSSADCLKVKAGKTYKIKAESSANCSIYLGSDSYYEEITQQEFESRFQQSFWTPLVERTAGRMLDEVDRFRN